MDSPLNQTLKIIENGVCMNFLGADDLAEPSSVSQSSQNEGRDGIELSLSRNSNGEDVVRLNPSDISREGRGISLEDLLNPAPSFVDESSPPKPKQSKHSDVHDEVMKRCKHFEETSKNYSAKYEKSLPKFTPSEVFVGDLLGKGGYANVHEIKSILLFDYDDSNDADQRESRKRMKANVFSREKRNFSYAIKFLRKDVMDNKQLYQLASVDITLEAKLLCSLFHPNIIQLKGFCESTLEGYSLILDRLHEGLDQRIVKWKKQEASGSSKKIFNLRKKSTGKKEKEAGIPNEKMKALYDITSALQYIHGKNIVYRDIKPANFGFDVEGTVKLFDFGLSKDLSSSKKLRDGTYILTRAIGSQRYMAPEVYTGEPYNTTADIYSFSIMLWEILTMKQPYQGFSNEHHVKLVFHGTHRPAITKAIPKPLRSVLESGWSEDLFKRPKFETIRNALSEFILMRGQDNLQISSFRR